MLSTQRSVFDLEAIAANPAKHEPKVELGSYTHIKAYHCCRTRDIRSYERDGIRFISRKEVETDFRSIFEHVPTKYLDEAIARRDVPLCPPEIFAGLDERFLLTYCGHYVLYGSETLQKFAGSLRTPGEANHLEVLRTIGTPKVLVLEIPMDETPSEFIDELDKKMELLAAHRYSEVYEIDTMMDCAMSLRRPVPPEWIVSHHTPKRVVDPFDGKRVYSFD